MENSKLITEAVQYIQKDVSDSSMTIEDVARHAGFSTDYFNRIFLAHTGFNVMEYPCDPAEKGGEAPLRK